MDNKLNRIKELLKKNIKRQVADDNVNYWGDPTTINREIYRQYAGGGREKLVIEVLMELYKEELGDNDDNIFVKSLISAGFNSQIIIKYFLNGYFNLSNFNLRLLWKIYVNSKDDNFLSKILEAYKLQYNVLSLIIARDVSSIKRLANNPKILDIYRLTIMNLNNVSFSDIIGIMNKKNMFSNLPKPYYNVLKERIDALPFHRQVDMWQHLKDQHHGERLKTLHLFSKINDKDYDIIGGWNVSNIIIKSKTKPLYGIADMDGNVVIKPVFNEIGSFNSLNTTFAKSYVGNKEIEPGLYEIHRDGKITVVKK